MKLKITSNYNESPTKRKKRITILEAAYNLFVEKGIQDVSMQEIAEAAGIQRRSLYNYYNDMEQVAIDLMKCQFEDIKNLDWDSEGKTAYEEVENIVNQIYSYIISNPDYVLFTSYFEHYFRKGYKNSNFVQLVTSYHAPANFQELVEKQEVDHTINPIFAEKLSDNIYILLISMYSLAQKIMLQNIKLSKETSHDFSTIRAHVDLMLDLIKA